MSQNHLNNEIFDELMANAFELKRKYPKAEDCDIATLVCTPYKEHEDHEIIVFQVIINLVNAFR